jgi:YD repeat-containing protein
MYPTKVTNSLGHSVSTSYDFNVNDSSHPNNGGVLGVPVKITDPNGATSITVYDDFGRPIETYLPGRKPGSNKPNQVTKYYYFNESAMSPCNASTNCLTGLGKELSGKGPKMMVYQGNLQSDTGTLGKISASHTYYNGIGQSLQTRQLWYEGEASNAGIPVASAGKKDILLSQVYNALGQVTHQSLPYTANPHTSLTSSAFDTRNVVSDSSIKKEIHSYDGFGRSISVASPDGTNQTTSYDVGGNPLKVRLSNENCNDGDPNTLCVTSAITTDAFGQTTLVEENTGSKTLSTRFKYHPLLGTVTETIDTNGNIVSAINYDVLGRKVNMWDIDMSPPGTLGAQSDTESSEVLAGEAIAATCSSWVTMATQVHFDANNNGLFDDGVSNIVQSSEQVCGDFKTIDGIKLRVLGGTVGEWWRAYNSGCHDDKLGIDGEPNINFRPLVQNNNGFQGEVHLDVPLKYKVVASDRCTFDPENNAAINCSFCGNKHVDFLIQEIPPTPTNTPTVTPIPAGKAWAYEYDKVGNLTKQTNPKGQVTTLTYDELYRLKTREVNGTTILSNSYDNCVNGKGKICEKISYDPTSSRELEKKRFEYTKRGQNSKLSKTLSNLPDSQVNGKTFTNSYTYDQGGRILSTNYSFPSGLSLSGETINYTYNRPYLTKIAGTDTYASGAQFNKNGAMVEFISGNGVINSYTYDANNSRLKSLSVQGQNMASEDRLQLSYTYDPIGNITKITDENSAHANTEFNLNQNFTYDPLSRLTEVTGAYTANFSYDDIGNIITKNEGGSSVTLSYSNNSGGFYHRPKTANIQGTQQSFQYDAIGNMTSDGTRTYDYDSNNRLSQTGDATFYYGAGGQRIAKIISGGLNTYYVSPELEIIISSDGKTSWRKNYYFAGKLAAVREGGDVIIPPTPVSGTPTKRPTSTIPPTPAGVPGDANGDKLVDLQDYTVWTTFYNTSTQDGVRAGDFNGNGSVEGRDYITWHNNYSTTPATGTQIPSPSSGQLISNLQENGRGTWNVAADLKVGDIQYSDRTFAFTFIPSEVLGSEWIQTSNDSKSYTGDVLATFKVNSNSKVYIALDDRSNIPSWLSSWTDSGMDIVNNENIPVSFSMYEKDFSSGQTVSLGSIGNTKYGMYSIIVISMGI